MLRYVPDSAGAAFTRYECANSSVVSPKLYPALNAATFASKISCFPPNLRSSQLSVVSGGRPYIHDRSPSANMFFARSDSFFPIPMSSVARTVIEVIGTL